MLQNKNSSSIIDTKYPKNTTFYNNFENNTYYGSSNYTPLLFSTWELKNGPPDGLVFADPMGRYGNFDIYEKDQAPYYGSIYNFRKISNIPENKFLKLPIIIKNLDDLYNEEKIKKKIEMEIDDNLDTQLHRKDIYIKDPKPYYDSSIMEKEMNKKILNEIQKNKLVDREFKKTNLLIEKIIKKERIQNFKNSDKEETNKIIRSFDYKDTSWYREREKLKITYKNFTISNSTGKYPIYEDAEEKKHNIIEIDEIK